MNTLKIRIISFVIFSVFCIILTYWIININVQNKFIPENIVYEPPSIDLSKNLFGEETLRNINIRLFGIIIIKQPVALISIDENPMQIALLGKKINRNIKIDEIKSRSIIISQNGIKSEVFLPLKISNSAIYLR